MEFSTDIEIEGDTPAKEMSTAQAPRFLAVERLSAHEHEKEWLFFGKQVKFRITNIIQGGSAKTKEHRQELKLLNNIQKLLRNGTPQWTQTQIALFEEYCQLRDLR